MKFKLVSMNRKNKKLRSMVDKMIIRKKKIEKVFNYQTHINISMHFNYVENIINYS